jgi:hypothetical protein
MPAPQHLVKKTSCSTRLYTTIDNISILGSRPGSRQALLAVQKGAAAHRLRSQRPIRLSRLSHMVQEERGRAAALRGHRKARLHRRDAFLRELTQIVAWYNESRPHTWLGGKTPNERYFGRIPANRRPRFEPRSRWPRGSPWAKPWALIRGTPGVELSLEVRFQGGRRHLPIVTLERAA